MLDCADVSNIFDLTTGFLQEQIFKRTPESYFISFTNKLLCTENESLTTISRKTGYSPKHVIHTFKKLVGISPKKYQRIYRINRAIAMLQDTKELSYTDISFHCGFYDQAHFIKEFHRFTGFSPHQYHINNKLYPHVIPMAKI